MPDDAEFPEILLPERPRTRGDCVDGPRPCPWVSCRWNLYLDVSPATGAIKWNWPDREPADMDPDGSCVLDVAARDGVTLEEVGGFLRLTRERVRQIEVKGLVLLRGRGVRLGREP